jgi:aldose sugar dehydrogenase
MRLFAAALSLCVVAACGAQPQAEAGTASAATASATGGDQPAQPPPTPTTRADAEVVRIARGLQHPWGLAFLPDGRMLVTERPGRLRIVAADGTLSAPCRRYSHAARAACSTSRSARTSRTTVSCT